MFIGFFLPFINFYFFWKFCKLTEEATNKKIQSVFMFLLSLFVPFAFLYFQYTIQKELNKLAEPIPKPELKPTTLSQKPITEVKKESLFTKLFKKKVKKEEQLKPKLLLEEPLISQPILKPEPKKPLFPILKKEEIKPIETKKPLFSFLKKTKKEEKSDLTEVKEAIQKAKGIRLEREPIKMFNIPKFQKPIELKKIEKLEISTEEDVKKEINNLINEIKKSKHKNIIQRNYKKALVLYNKIKDTDARLEYNQKLKTLYNKLTK